MIKKTKGGYKVVSHSGKNLSKIYKSYKQAGKRLGQIEYFKHKGSGAKRKGGSGR